MLYRTDVTAAGAVLLADRIVCDGFVYGVPYRVQTHVHDDHMDDFDSSKQFQDIICSRATRDLLIAEFNADLKYRSNIVGLDFGEVCAVDGGSVTLLPSAHMLGSSQVVFQSRDGSRIGYSGDFQWPMSNPMAVDVLVVDSTYGSPGKRREFSQDDANGSLLEIVKRRIRAGPVNIKAFRGTVQRALEVLSGELNAPILASPRLCRDIEVYRRYGSCFDRVVSTSDEEGKEIARSSRYVRLYSKGDAVPEHSNGSSVLLSAFMSRPNDPVVEWNEWSYSVALSDHADFPGTLDYVASTGAKLVITDNTRGHGVDLAIAIRERLGVEAYPSTNISSKGWG